MRGLLLVAILSAGLVGVSQAQSGTSNSSCGLDLKRCAVLLEPLEWYYMPGTPCAVPPAVLERTECIFVSFLEERSRRGLTYRDSVFEASHGSIRPERFSLDRRLYYRQYGAMCQTTGDTMIYLNALYDIGTAENRAVYDYLVDDYKRTHAISDAQGDTLFEFKAFLTSHDGLRPDGWRRHWFHADDGGDQYFQVLFDLRRRTIIKFAVNGPYQYPRR